MHTTQMMHLQLMWSQQGGGAPPPPALRMQLFQMDQQRLALLAMLPLPWGPDNGGASDGGLLPSSVASGMPKGSSSDWPGEAVWSMGFGGNRNGWGESNGTPMDSALSQQKETNPPSSAQQPHSASPEDAFYSSIRAKNASADEEQAVLAPAVASLFAAHHASISPGPPAGGGSVSGEVSASERPEEYPTQERLRALQLERRQAEQQAEAATPTKEVCAGEVPTFLAELARFALSLRWMNPESMHDGDDEREGSDKKSRTSENDREMNQKSDGSGLALADV